jgi:predicted ArsR family transcriptional regulator
VRRRADISNIDGVKFAADSGTRPAPTRDEVARLLLEQGPATAASLGERLGISPTAVRRHLDALVADGLATDREQRPLGGRQRGRGRPPREFLLTDAGRGAFPHAYDDLAAAALRFLAETGGERAVADFAERRVRSVEERHGAAVRGAAPERRVDALARALSVEGYAASAHPMGVGGQLCQHHCPVAHVAAEFPQLCEAETRAFERLLGTHVQRLATIARGDAVCTTYIPGAPDPAGTDTHSSHGSLGGTRA